MSACKSYRYDSLMCDDGFPQKPICSGLGPVGCFACGQISEAAIPLCQRDEMPAHMVTDDGRPRFTRHAAQPLNPTRFEQPS